MRWTSLLLLFCACCLIGGAAADALGQAQYSRTQSVYLNGPTEEGFSEDAQKYWNSYIRNANDSSIVAGSPVKTMHIWMNNFPLAFQSNANLKASSFNIGGIGAGAISPTEWNSIMLERGTTSKFGLSQSWSYTPSAGSSSFRVVNGTMTGTVGKSQGMILTQGIDSRFGV